MLDVHSGRALMEHQAGPDYFGVSSVKYSPDGKTVLMQRAKPGRR